MLTEKDYCDYDTCVVLREVGCRIETEWYIHQPSYERGNCYLCFGIPRETSVLDECDYIPRLSLYEAQKWLREERGMLLQPTYLELSDEWICVLRDKNKRHGYSAQKQKHYEEALSEGLRTSIKILRDEQKENN